MPEESKEDRDERERFYNVLSSHKRLLDNPRVIISILRSSELLKRGDPLAMFLLHCDTSKLLNGVSIQAFCNCKRDAPDGCIEACCTVKNVNAFSPGVPSVLHFGGVDQGLCINSNSSCNIIAKGHHQCAETTEEAGVVVVDIIKELALTCKRRKIGLILLPVCGSSTGVMENVMERLPFDIRENTSSITTHPQNLSK